MKKRLLPLLYLAGFSLWASTLSCSLAARVVNPDQAGPPPASTGKFVPAQATSPAPPPEASPLPSLPSPTLAPATAAPSLPAETAQSPASPPEALQTCEKDLCIVDGSFLLKRPVGGNGRKTIVYSDRFGSYRAASSDARHGVYFLNSTGTPVVAAAGGKVVVAGDDLKVPYGPYPGMYGNLVILQHELPGFDQPVYTLYAHLSQVSVKAEDTVKAGQQIGLVGMSGSVKGSTLQFEVRVGENNYANARNPELWLEPLLDEQGNAQGALAGRVLDSQGNYVPVKNIVVEHLAGPGLPAIDQFYLKTYLDKRLIGQTPWEENFAAGDLPPGEYQISFWEQGLQQQVVKIKPGQLTVVTFHLP